MSFPWICLISRLLVQKQIVVLCQETGRPLSSISSTLNSPILDAAKTHRNPEKCQKMGDTPNLPNCKMRKWWSNLEIGGIPDYPGPFLCQTNSGDRQVARLPAKPGMRDRRMQRLPLLDQKMPCPSRRTWRKWTGRPDMTHVSHRDRVTFHLAAESSQMVLQWLQKMISIRRQFRSGSSRLQPMPVFSSQLQAEAERQRL